MGLGASHESSVRPYTFLGTRVLGDWAPDFQLPGYVATFIAPVLM